MLGHHRGDFMKTFEYFKPKTIDEAINLYDTYGSKAKFLAGGTDLAVMVDDGMISPDYVIDLKGINELKKIELQNEYLYIGAGVTFTDIIHSELVKKHAPVLWEASKTVASNAVRNRATLAGNICSAVPSADSAPALLVLDAIVLIKGKESIKEVPITQFFVGPRKTVLQIPEIVLGVKIPLLNKNFGSCYIKLGRYDGEDLAQVGVAVLVNENMEFKISFGAVAPVPVRAFDAEKLLSQKEISESKIEAAIPVALGAISPISDVRASKEYRLHVSGILLKRAINTSLLRLQGKGPQYGESLV